MKERPILFSGPMVRAILADRKTQTRREVKPHVIAAPEDVDPNWRIILTSSDKKEEGQWRLSARNPNGLLVTRRGREHVQWRGFCPYGQPGDRLWVKETHGWIHPGMLQGLDPDPDSIAWRTVYRADGEPIPSMREHGQKWRPSIFCSRDDSRITLEIVSIRVERLQDISEEDAMAEGVRRNDWQMENGEAPESYREAFRLLWESINGPGSWDANPWVWVVEFKRVEEGVR